jgi:hypothetical protein
MKRCTIQGSGFALKLSAIQSWIDFTNIVGDESVNTLHVDKKLDVMLHHI